MESLEPESAGAAPEATHATGDAVSSGSGVLLHHQLRHATEAAHRKLDGFTIGAGFFASQGRYSDYLYGLAAFHAAYSQAALPLDKHGWLRRWSIDQHPLWIANEIVQLRAPAPATQPVVSMTLASRSELLGSLYVLAGSTLGARMLQKMFVENDQPVPGGSAYLEALAGSLRWGDFVAFLKTAEEWADVSGAINGALATFSCVHRSLGGSP